MGFYDSTQTDAAITAALVPYGTAAERDTAIAAALASVTLSNGQSWTGGPTFNLLRGSNVLRNLSVAGALPRWRCLAGPPFRRAPRHR